MYKRSVLILSTIVFASGILIISVLKSASINYAFSGKPTPKETTQPTPKEIKIDYTLPYPGGILPDSPIWPLKAGRDKLWFLVTTDSGKRGDLALLFADKRLAMAKTLFEKKKPDLGFSVLTKAEKYLEEASRIEKENRAKGLDTGSFLTKLANSSLKHRQIQEEILLLSPEDAKPKVLGIQEYSNNTFNSARDGLQSLGLTPPNNPFLGE